MSESARRLPSLYRKTLTLWCSVVAVVVLTGGFLGSHRLEQQAVDFLTQSLTTSARLMETHNDRPEVRDALAGGVGTSLRYSQTVKHPMLYVALPLTYERGIIG